MLSQLCPLQISVLQDPAIPAKVTWAILFTTYICLMIYFTYPAIYSFTQEPALSVTLSEANANETQFPTITMCTIQHSDRWNLARSLLNQIDYDLTDNGSQAGNYFHGFAQDFLEHQWMAQEGVLKSAERHSVAKKLNEIMQLVLVSGNDQFLQKQISRHMRGIGGESIEESLKDPWTDLASRAKIRHTHLNPSG